MKWGLFLTEYVLFWSGTKSGMYHKEKIGIIAIVLMGLCMSGNLYGQQGLQLTQYMLNRYALNPAYGGLENSLSITGSLRSQWSEFEGAPKSQMINAHMPFYYLHGSVGMAVENEQLGAIKRIQATGSYNYVQETEFGLFSIGARVGIQQITLNANELRTPGGIYQDQAIDHRDPILQSANQNGIAPVWGVGLYYAGPYIEGGIVFDNLPENNFTAGDAQFKSSKHASIFLTGEYVYDDQISFEPSLLVKSDFAQTQTDIGTLVNYNNLFGGISVRGYNSNSLDALNFIVGSKLNEHWRISYSFDMGISGLRNFHDGTHELNVNYNLNKKIRTGELPRIIYNPRYN